MRYLLLLLVPFLLVSCAPSQQEVDMNELRQESFKALNTQRTYEPVRITGIQRIEGKNITIVTMSQMDMINVPDIQYDTSDTDLAAKALDVVTAGIVAVGAYKSIQAMGDATRATVVAQPEPLVVRPEIVHPEIVYPEAVIP